MVVEAATRYGTLRFISEDHPIGFSLRKYGEWGHAEVEALLPFVAEGGIVLDVGANIGTHALAFAKIVGPSGKVIAFEPQPIIADLLRANVLSNGYDNIIVQGVAISDFCGELGFELPDYDNRGNFGAVAFADADAAQDRVQAITIDSMELEACQLIKIDAEGMGAKVLNGAQYTLRRLRPVIFVEANTAAEGVDIFRVLSELNYDNWFLELPAYNPHNFKGNHSNDFGVASESAVLSLPVEVAAEKADLVRGRHILDCDDLADAILGVARWGDRTPYDRKPSALLARLEEAQASNDYLRRKIKGIYDSTSWRITAPLRALGRWLKGR